MCEYEGADIDRLSGFDEGADAWLGHLLGCADGSWLVLLGETFETVASGSGVDERDDCHCSGFDPTIVSGFSSDQHGECVGPSEEVGVTPECWQRLLPSRIICRPRAGRSREGKALIPTRVGCGKDLGRVCNDECLAVVVRFR